MKKCSVVDGNVQCSRMDTAGGGTPQYEQQTNLDDRRKALDRLIKDYREQLDKLKVIQLAVEVLNKARIMRNPGNILEGKKNS